MGADRELVGRESELSTIADFLTRTRDGGLVLLGEAGLGKSALWRATERLAVELGMLTLIATPGEGEERYSGSVLIDLLHDIELDDVALTAPLREAIDAVLLRSAGAVNPNPQAVLVAVRDVLAHLAAGRRVVVLVDDVQWADPTSAEALAFAARRLDGVAVQFVLTRRSGFERTPLEAVLLRRALTYVEPRPLALDETGRLLLHHLALAVSPRVLRLVHEKSRGNPLFALEVGRVLVECGIPPIGEPLGVPAEMAAFLGLRVQQLPEEQRTLLLAVALDPTVREETLVALVGLDAVERAVAARLLTIGERDRVRAWHPLLAEAAREDATPGRRRELHRRLAELDTRPGGRARHLALGAPGAGEELASLLSEESAAAAARGAVETGVELAELALARTPDGSPRRPERVLNVARRLADAAEGQRLTDFLMSEIDGLPLGRDRGSGWLLLLDGVIGSIPRAGELIDAALSDCGDATDVRAQALDWKAHLHVGMLVDGVSEAMAWAEESRALGSTTGPGRDWCLVHSGRAPESSVGIAYHKRHIWRGEPARAERWLVDSIATAEAEGHFRPAMSMRLHLLDLLVRAGRVGEARVVLALLDDADLAGKESPDEEAAHALLEAQAGDAPATRDWADLAGRRAAEFGHVWIGLDARRACALAALREGGLEEAEHHLRAVWQHVDAAGVGDPGIFPVAPDLADTLVLLSRPDEARVVLGWLEQRALEQQHPWATATAARSRALLALSEGSVDVATAVAEAESAADRLATLGLAHDAARGRLVLGSALRRRRQWGAARDLLDRARDGFDALGADGWADAARAELTRVGGRPRRGTDELTPAELATSRFAADGLSNKAIARRTNVSVGTVEAHLSSSYAKLGVRSRSQLAARLPVRAE